MPPKSSSANKQRVGLPKSEIENETPIPFEQMVPGLYLYCKSKDDDLYYSAKLLSVENGEFLIHYQGWNSRCDTFFTQEQALNSFVTKTLIGDRARTLSDDEEDDISQQSRSNKSASKSADFLNEIDELQYLIDGNINHKAILKIKDDRNKISNNKSLTGATTISIFNILIDYFMFRHNLHKELDETEMKGKKSKDSSVEKSKERSVEQSFRKSKDSSVESLSKGLTKEKSKSRSLEKIVEASDSIKTADVLGKNLAFKDEAMDVSELNKDSGKPVILLDQSAVVEIAGDILGNKPADEVPQGSFQPNEQIEGNKPIQSDEPIQVDDPIEGDKPVQAVKLIKDGEQFEEECEEPMDGEEVEYKEIIEEHEELEDEEEIEIDGELDIDVEISDQDKDSFKLELSKAVFLINSIGPTFLLYNEVENTFWSTYKETYPEAEFVTFGNGIHLLRFLDAVTKYGRLNYEFSVLFTTEIHDNIVSNLSDYICEKNASIYLTQTACAYNG
uniref:Tudor-knot domain-containing protein n=1 Tax=Rhabditophanes sp. KR3021 TaxID=114890 RepID=A0AC35TM87_9BILA